MTLPQILLLTRSDVERVNYKILEFHALKHGLSQIHHFLRDANGLEGCLNGVFYQTSEGHFLNAPIDKMAGLLLYRIAQGQFFLDGNKRTAVKSVEVFLIKNGYGIHWNRKEIKNLLWGFGHVLPDGQHPLSEVDAIEYVESNIYI